MTGKPRQPSRGNKPATGTRSSAAQRTAAQRAVIAASGRSNRWLTVGAPIALVIVLVAVLVVVKVSQGPSKPKSGVSATTASSAVTAEVTSVPEAVLNQVGLGAVSTPPTKLSGAALTAGGKPRVVYIGAEWCPYCAAERWPLVIALSRFGTLSGLGQVRSSPSDVYPNTATLTFHGSTYSSTTIALTAKEIYSNQAEGSSYATLDTLDSADAALFQSVGNGFPFLDVGGKYLFSASYVPSVLSGLTQEQIAADLATPTAPVAKAIDGAANLITAAICATTANQPSSVCTASGVVAAASALPAT